MEAYLQMATNFPNILSTDLRPIKGDKLPPGAVSTRCSTNPICAQHTRSMITTPRYASLKQPSKVSGKSNADFPKCGHFFPQCRVH